MLSRHEIVGKSVFTAGGDAGHTAYAVRVPHELSSGHIDVHGAGTRALPTAATFGSVAPYAENTQHAPEPLPCASGAEVVAERALYEQAAQQKNPHDSRGRREQFPVYKFAEIVRPFEQCKAEPPSGQQKIENIAAQLEVALQPARYLHLRQTQRTSQLPYPVLRGTQRANPAAEKYTHYQCRRKHPV